MEEKLNPLIMIDDTYGISVDPIDYSLRKNVISEKSGKPRQDTVGYYSSIRSCLKAYVAEKAHDCLESDDDMTLKEAAKLITSAIERIHATIDEKFPEFEVTEK